MIKKFYLIFCVLGLTISSFSLGFKYGTRKVVSVLCNKYKYDFCVEVKNKTIYVLKDEFIYGDN